MAQKITERKPHAPPLVSTDQNSLTRSGQSLWVLRAVPLIASVVTRVFQTTASEIFYIINSRSCRWRWLSGKNMNYCTSVTLSPSISPTLTPTTEHGWGPEWRKPKLLASWYTTECGRRGKGIQGFSRTAQGVNKQNSDTIKIHDEDSCFSNR